MERANEACGRQLFEANLETIEGVVASTCRRYRLRDEEAEDFRSSVFIRLLEDDGAVLRKFRGGSSFATFLAVVVGNLARDWRIAKWGRYRPSRAAERLGTVAVRLEILLHRDGYSFDEAVRMLRENHAVDASWQQLEAAAGELPERGRPRFDGAMPVVDPSHDPRGELGKSIAPEVSPSRVDRALAAALAALDAEDRLILRLHFVDGLTIAAIARTLDLRQRRLYTRIHKSLRTLRRILEAEGVARRAVAQLLAGSESGLAEGVLTAVAGSGQMEGASASLP